MENLVLLRMPVFGCLLVYYTSKECKALNGERRCESEIQLYTLVYILDNT